ncbi:mitochondrial mRNA pseudouridine synthase RPUSD3-like [Discoglossus pictus]
MALLYRQLRVLSRSGLALSELGCPSASCHLHAVRTKSTVSWHRTDLQQSGKECKTKESRVNILRDPGVVPVGKLTKDEICEHLMRNIVHRTGPLVAFNKPPGLSIAGKQEEVSVMLLLTDLQQRLGLREELHVVKAAPKESSGVVLLSTCHQTTKHMEDFYAKCRKVARPVTTYCAVTVGVPSPPEGEINVALKVERIEEYNMVVPVMDPSKGSLERREVKRTQTRYKVLDHAEGCALVQLQPMSVFQAQLQVHASLKFCPLLGDHTYSARVGKVLGEDIYVPVDIALPRTQVLEEPLLRRMRLTPQQMHRLPLHLHLHQLLLPSCPTGGDPALLTALPPPFFQRTLQLLGLNLKEQPELYQDIAGNPCNSR